MGNWAVGIWLLAIVVGQVGGVQVKLFGPVTWQLLPAGMGWEAVSVNAGVVAYSSIVVPT